MKLVVASARRPREPAQRLRLHWLETLEIVLINAKRGQTETSPGQISSPTLDAPPGLNTCPPRPPHLGCVYVYVLFFFVRRQTSIVPIVKKGHSPAQRTGLLSTSIVFIDNAIVRGPQQHNEGGPLLNTIVSGFSFPFYIPHRPYGQDRDFSYSYPTIKTLFPRFFSFSPSKTNILSSPLDTQHTSTSSRTAGSFTNRNSSQHRNIFGKLLIPLAPLPSTHFPL